MQKIERSIKEKLRERGVYFGRKIKDAELASEKDGSLVSPPLEDLSPLLPRNVLKSKMLGGLHPKSVDY